MQVMIAVLVFIPILFQHKTSESLRWLLLNVFSTILYLETTVFALGLKDYGEPSF